jgi:hypothetical protein
MDMMVNIRHLATLPLGWQIRIFYFTISDMLHSQFLFGEFSPPSDPKKGLENLTKEFLRIFFKNLSYFKKNN